MIQQLYPQVQHNFQFELNKDMHLAAAHYIPHEDAGKCQNVHGHTYFINITIAGDELDNSGFLVNFASIKKLIHNRFDHTILNEHTDLFSTDNPNYFPTTEGVARAIWEVVQKELDTQANQPKCVQVFVRETPTSYVVFRPRRKEGQE
ncbi:MULTISPECIES: 6-carboxytetrahydropterin synthase QueD [Metabacillus]|jgi:6-pyruvoyltetrahydropterin/6-carboxytetrahydropterin synthase|uniref:6-carboxy-5,6,7,8-tetrahydropterin synthase n=1 Tax=Metabacillus rhizolycopersici TaxID=2875709 RepID=A0ABS7V0Q9_9BACI|nr:MULTISPECIES: 6-carboxytetrahydropterin synthase QueD [Metabacillus]MBZ5753760.1 6-carboxytetrahydropterin synthase QueD [Metabacillus rhizolycopersici]MCM3652383.1 6-carboxytetrahydropterin synthase QueD [Metabacillus litoralis]